MSIEHDIAAAQNQREALIVLGRALDRIEASLATAESKAPAADTWSEWTPSVKAELLSEDDLKAELSLDSASRIQAIRDELAACSDADDRRALQARLQLARDAAGEAVYGGFGAPLDLRIPDGKRAEIASNGVNGTVDLPPVSEERRKARYQWALQNRLNEFIPLDPQEAGAAFAKGGPMWLYLANRDAVMQLPYEARQWLVADIELDSPAEAQEVGRDILKSTQSVDKAITQQAIDAISASRGA